jgi:hypothetical protein
VNPNRPFQCAVNRKQSDSSGKRQGCRRSFRQQSVNFGASIFGGKPRVCSTELLNTPATDTLSIRIPDKPSFGRRVSEKYFLEVIDYRLRSY